MDPKIIVILDAFGKTYYSKFKYLKKLSEENIHLNLEPIFGYQAGDDAFYSGEYPAESGIWFNFVINKYGSVYGGLKYFMPLLRITDNICFIRNATRLGISMIVSKFKNISNLSKIPYNIPTDIIPHIDLRVKYHPADMRYPRENMFSYLRMIREKYIIFISNVVFDEFGYKIHYTKRGNDAAAKDIFLKNLNKKTKYYIIHLTELDKIGHKYYYNSDVKEVIDKEEKLIEEILSYFFKLFPEGKFIIFGDHGMAPVKRTIDSNEILNFIREFDKNLLYFTDSTFLRIYLNDKNIKNDVIEELKESFNLFIVDKNVAKKYKVPYKSIYGDIIISAKPYEIFYPNFFDIDIPKGMHGYVPEIPEAAGLIITNQSINKTNNNKFINIPAFKKMLLT